MSGIDFSFGMIDRTLDISYCVKEFKRMDNQHKKITGYRDLSQDEIDLMNEIKATEATVAALVARVRDRDRAAISETSRQAAIARTELEGGFMRLVRAVAKPASPWV